MTVTPREFDRQMDRIIAQTDVAAVKSDAMTLIVRELGEGVPAYLPALERLAKRLEQLSERMPRAPTEPVL